MAAQATALRAARRENMFTLSESTPLTLTTVVLALTGDDGADVESAVVFAALDGTGTTTAVVATTTKDPVPEGTVELL